MKDIDPNDFSVSDFFDYNIDIRTKTLYIGDDEETDDEDKNGGINERVAAKAVKGLHILDHLETPGDITILMNIIGGEEPYGLAIYDAIKTCTHDTIIKVYGQCMSIGAWILQAGTRRLLSPNSLVMIHTGTWGFGEDHPESVRSWLKVYEKSEEQFENILLDRIWQKNPDFTREKLHDILRFDTIFTPQEAIDLGLADEIIEKIT